MMYLLIPKGAEQISADTWIKTSDVTLGGYFYDHLCEADGKIVGLRYWLDSDVNINTHPVYKEFATDTRLKFNKNSGYVDILFDENKSDAFKNGKLAVETVQDFGGDSAIQADGRFGIAFSL